MIAPAAGLEASWKVHLQDEFSQPYMMALSQFLREQRDIGKVIYPSADKLFHALNSTPLSAVKVVILGQDPYHGPDQAHGLCFSVPRGVAAPPSLKNIFKELARDLAIPLPAHGCLQGWAEQGVLLLNTSLSVEHGQAGSHADKGWQRFTDRIIALVNEQCAGVVFVLWGAHAQGKQKLIDTGKHHVLQSVHPSPLSAYRGFLGCGHFSAVNRLLIEQGKPAINWQLPV
ncbi:uracil-DNA glycosylase [Atopomonas sediminilitoris]|uniref:uracil-DNA glycosylase n=1 Tax=Atopomonas sediminilitoris TaxID=2919919 RepID=UPI001F4E68A8|nr:uracil-DNA glycosylase [Atopomonas sediminilitoris]MCJ8168606.1 uracil-DNA glycosylase [Atopomonas sediminilitoris]